MIRFGFVKDYNSYMCMHARMKNYTMYMAMYAGADPGAGKGRGTNRLSCRWLGK